MEQSQEREAEIQRLLLSNRTGEEKYEQLIISKWEEIDGMESALNNCRQ